MELQSFSDDQFRDGINGDQNRRWYSPAITSVARDRSESQQNLLPHYQTSEESPGWLHHRHNAPTQRLKPPSRTSHLRSWVPELAASMVSVISLVSITAALLVFNGRAATDLKILGPFALNGFVAFIATINKACLTIPVCSAMMQEMWLMFASEASKSSPKSRLSDLDLHSQAATGSLASLKFLLRARRSMLISSLGCLITISTMAHSTFTQQLIKLELLSAPTSVSIGNIPWTETFGDFSDSSSDKFTQFVVNIFNSVFVQDVQPPPLTCPRENCAWPLTSSLAVCGTCDRSTYTPQSCNASDGYCNFTLASGLTTNLSVLDTQRNGVAFRAIPTAVHELGTHDRLDIARFELFGVPFSTIDDGIDEPIQAPVNTECHFWLCVNTYSTNMSLSGQHQFVISSAHSWEASPDYYLLNASSSTTNQEVFRVNISTWSEWAVYMPDTFRGALNINDSISLSESFHDVIILFGLWRGTENPGALGSNLSMSLSNYIRTWNTTSRPEYNGNSATLSVVIHWQWLIFHVTLVTASVLFLALVLMRTVRSQVPVWKGSLLTLLLCQIDDHAEKAAYEHVDERNGLTMAIGNTRVRFQRDDQGRLKFRSC
ncbi:hypothetical protein K461DRAFT_291186 [Myriangium duriaei CBS 260.36]|uniref:Uncharacterized protein n=1 Tax=Myriangium duriaei CBS 260.36 TaxID=1168546 RepID=A0A9P4J6G1_9PEZI|nr:hypothetical protein K461DRAFT_291186 [Myriangium duriaei CBS 260.36]